MNNEELSRAIEAAERELATIGGAVSLLCLCYPMGMPCPSLKWVQAALKPLGVEFVDCLIFPHRNGHEYPGLLVSIRPLRELPDDWLVTKSPCINDTGLQWIHRALNAEYYKLAA